MEDKSDVTTIRITKKTLNSLRLEKIQLQAKLKKELTFDEVIDYLKNRRWSVTTHDDVTLFDSYRHADMEYCETGRLFYINKLMPNHGKTTAPTVIGKFEHTVIEQFYKFTKIDWKELDSFENDKNLDNRISLAVQDSIEIGRENFPLFFDCLEKILTQ